MLNLFFGLQPILQVTSFSQVRYWEMTLLDRSSSVVFPVPYTALQSLHCWLLNMVVQVLSINCCRSLILPAARQMSSAKQRSEMYTPEMLAPTHHCITPITVSNHSDNLPPTRISLIVCSYSAYNILTNLSSSPKNLIIRHSPILYTLSNVM